MHMVEQKFVKMQEHFTKIWPSPRVNIDLLHAQSLDEKDDVFTDSTVIEVPKTFSIKHDAKQHEECESPPASAFSGLHDKSAQHFI